MKSINKVALCLFALAILLAMLAIVINGGILYAVIAVAVFIVAISLQICKLKPIFCACFNLILYAAILFEWLFIGKVKDAILIDVILLVVFSLIHYYRKKCSSKNIY